ncbi:MULTISPECIES: hypothetical protein [Streptomyces]|uniref:hypothetical protein n=1 Tax=Streptomyces TaxID=1883 RepID=UPI001428A5C0|nr:hypothetical protein [Streptomyces durhamensis]
MSSNDTALYGLAAIEYLALLGDRMPWPGPGAGEGERRRTGGGARPRVWSTPRRGT